MKFTQPCFIRMNTHELRNKLKDLGYKICVCCEFKDAKWINNLIFNSTIHGIGYSDETRLLNNWTVEDELNLFLEENTRYIDCGTNKELFLAISALTDDTDYMQWFIEDKYIQSGIGGQICGLEPRKKISEKWVLYNSKNNNVSDKIDDDIKNSYFEKSDYRKATVSDLIEHFK